ncbi:hypothetical protein AMECASPLE_038566 [Ameca splendens]|uniref:Microsomal glutathione S-transferase 2 n=1 Tax=Ameca splendens TaxID=208324 RepID=A0ABV0XLJ9_9TELE
MWHSLTGLDTFARYSRFSAQTNCCNEQTLCVCSQNCVEFYPVFLVTLWTCGMFFNEVVAAAAGLVYMVARQIYFNGYIQSTKKRLTGFYLTLAALLSLSVLALTGIVGGILDKYLYIHI